MARARCVEEPPKQSARTPFERDRARVVHSSALRRLAAKTQVVGPTSDDFVRNRLTHSLEVAQIGRELGSALGCDPDVVETSCLAHDLGHPPFGHNGEGALDGAAAAIGGFEGNAQTFRLLTRLEAKTTAPDGRSAGLNLTRATLDAVLKYPWLRDAAPAGATAGKYNAYADDAESFSWVRAGAPGTRACLEAQVMDWADDVAYSVHDVEDALVAQRVALRALRSAPDRADVLAVAESSYATDATGDELGEALDRLLALPYWPAEYDGTRATLGTLKNLTSRLVGRFCTTVVAATHDAYGREPLARYGADLVVPRGVRLEVAVLKAVAAHWVMRIDERAGELARQRELVTALVESLVAADGAHLAPAFRDDWSRAADDGQRLRTVVDQVASLTDPSAGALAQRLGV